MINQNTDIIAYAAENIGIRIRQLELDRIELMKELQLNGIVGADPICAKIFNIDSRIQNLKDQLSFSAEEYYKRYATRCSG